MLSLLLSFIILLIKIIYLILVGLLVEMRNLPTGSMLVFPQVCFLTIFAYFAIEINVFLLRGKQFWFLPWKGI
jgi:hypothetical protein